jgi:hypothetical protein
MLLLILFNFLCFLYSTRFVKTAIRKSALSISAFCILLYERLVCREKSFCKYNNRQLNIRLGRGLCWTDIKLIGQVWLLSLTKLNTDLTWPTCNKYNLDCVYMTTNWRSCFKNTQTFWHLRSSRRLHAVTNRRPATPSMILSTLNI